MDDKEKIKLLEKQIELLEKINELQKTIEMQRITTTPVFSPTCPCPTYPPIRYYNTWTTPGAGGAVGGVCGAAS